MTTQQDAVTEKLAPATGGVPRVRVETALYAVLALLALVLRLVDLDARLMAPAEAARALGALQLANGGESAVAQSPIVQHGAAFLFMLFRADDVFARFVPVLFGVALVLTPALFRRQLGRVGALIASLVFALSPVGLFYSRTMGPEIVVITAVLALVGGVQRFRETGESRWLALAGGALGLLLASGPGAWTLIVLAALLAAVVALFKAFGRGSRVWDAGAALVAQVAHQPSALTSAGITFLCVLVAVGTGGLFHLWGLAGIGQQLSDWLAGFGAGTGDLPWYGPAALVLLYEPLVTVFGLAGIVQAVRGGRMWRGLLAFWALAALVFLLVWPGRTGGDLLLVLAPLTFLAAERLGALADALSGLPSRLREWGVAGLALVLCGYLYMQVSGYANSGQSGFLTLTFVALGLLVLLAAGAAALVNPGAAVRGMALAGVVVLSLCTLAAARSVAFDYRENHIELLGVHTEAGVTRLASTLSRVSLQRVDGEYDLPVTLVGDDTTVLQWYLRRVTELTVTPGVSSAYETPAVVAPAEVEQAPGADYTGERFPVQGLDDVWGLNGQPLVRWLMFRERPVQPPPSTSVVLWIQLETNPQ